MEAPEEEDITRTQFDKWCDAKGYKPLLTPQGAEMSGPWKAAGGKKHWIRRVPFSNKSQALQLAFTCRTLRDASPHLVPLLLPPTVLQTADDAFELILVTPRCAQVCSIIHPVTGSHSCLQMRLEELQGDDLCDAVCSGLITLYQLHQKHLPYGGVKENDFVLHDSQWR